MKKIELYLLIQILKSFFLIFFIFTGISWLLQATRLLNLITVHKIPIIDVLFLSLNVIPNIVTNIIPFIVFFSILLSCIKLNKDKELITIYTLGLSLNEIIRPFLVFSLLVLTFSLFLSFLISPFYYNIFKNDEFNLRTNLDIQNVGLNSFFEFNNSIVINFEKEDDQYRNILIYQSEPKKNIILANKAKMEINDNRLDLKLYDGYKTEIKDNSNEAIIYDNYNFSINLKSNEEYNSNDKNTFNLNMLLKQKNYSIVNQRFIDSIILLSIIYLIIKNIIINLRFKIYNLLIVSLISITIIFLDNILGNLSTNNLFFIFFMYLNPMIPFFLNLKKT